MKNDFGLFFKCTTGIIVQLQDDLILISMSSRELYITFQLNPD